MSRFGRLWKEECGHSTQAAEEKNAENVIVLKDNPTLAQRYAQNWRTHAKHSVAYTGPRVHQADSDRSKPQPGNAGFTCGNKPKRGRKRFFDAVLYKFRFTSERTFAWKDKFKGLLLRFETLQIRHLGFKLMAFTLINLREFCGA